MDFKSIAHLCQDRAEAFRKACCEFVLLSRRPKLLADGGVAIAGSKLRDVSPIRVRYVSGPLFTEIQPNRKF